MTSPRWRDAQTWRAPLVAWAVGRAVVLVAGVIFSLVLERPRLGTDPAVPPWLRILGGWDTSWYLDVATRGYDNYTDLAGAVYTNLPFFPLTPLVMKAGIAVGANPFFFALVVNHVAFLAALVVLYRLTHQRFGHRTAHTTLWVAALCPPSVYASLAYSEAVTFFLAVCAGYLVHTRRWVAASGVAAVVTLSRPPGILVSLLVAAALWHHVDGTWVHKARRAAWAFVPSVLTLCAFFAWMEFARGAWNLPFIAQEAWRRGPLGVGLVTYLPIEVGDSIRALLRGDIGGFWFPAWRHAIFTALYLVLLVRLARMEPRGWRSPWVIYAAATLALPLSSGSMQSMTRFGLLAFPLAWSAASWLDDGGARRRRTALVVGLVLLVGLVAEMRWFNP